MEMKFREVSLINFKYNIYEYFKKMAKPQFEKFILD